MKHGSVLIPLGHTSLCNIDGTHQVLLAVNKFLVALGRNPLFNVRLKGRSAETIQRDDLYGIEPHLLIAKVQKTAIISIPAIYENYTKALEENAAFIPRIKEQYKKGAELESFCIGAFFLAATSLLKGKKCATYCTSANDFSNVFPDICLDNDKNMKSEDGMYTSGGTYSYLNLLIYLVEKNAGCDITVLTAKAFMIDIDRISQSLFIIFQGQKSPTDEPVKKAQEFIKYHFEEKLTVDQLASMLALGRPRLERRFKKFTSNPVVEYKQRVKMEVVKKSLESSREHVNEVIYNVGYTHTKAFRTTFKKLKACPRFNT